MGTLEACPLGPFSRFGGVDRPLIVVGVTHPQTCLVLRGRLRSLRAAGFRVVLISSPGELATRIAAEEGVEHCAIPMQRGMSPLADLISLVRLCFALSRLRPAIAEFSTPKAGLLGNIASFLCRVPVRIYILRGLRLETASGMTRRILQLSERITAVCSHMVVCNSKSLRSQALALGVVRRRKLRVIGNGTSSGVDVRHFMPPSSLTPERMRKSLGIPAGAPVIGFAGRLTRDKGIPELLDAFDSLLVDFPEARLLLTGWFDDSEDALSPAQRARIVNHPRILCTGFVTDTAPYYHAMDVLTLPTWREGFPNVVLEAAASGVPTVSTLATGARDAVLHERTGLLVPPGNPQALAAAIKRLLLSPEERVQMGAAARAWVADNFMHTRVQALTVALYRSLIRDAERQPAPALIKDEAAAGD
jgi:glycosyltransferase involved in cell wall biosynthesis